MATLLTSCNERPKEIKTLQPNRQNVSLSLRDSLIGKWGGLGESIPVFEIRKDSIYYVQPSTAYPYKIINRDFIIYFPDHKGLLQSIRVDHDTIFFYDDFGLARAYRSKKIVRPELE